jgi:hypothetical protein
VEGSDPQASSRSGRAPQRAGDHAPRRGADDSRESRVRSHARCARKRRPRHGRRTECRIATGLAGRV